MKKLTQKQAREIVETNGSIEAEGKYGECSIYFQDNMKIDFYAGMKKSDAVRDVWRWGQE